MNNKILVKILVVSIDKDIDCFLPINEKIYNIKKILLKYIFDKNTISDEDNNKYVLINARSNKIYNNNERIANTDIRNGSEIVLLKI